MLMTEEQARSKWCPHARQTGVTNRDTGSAASVNRAGHEHYGAENCNCIASDCMAWRRGTHVSFNGTTGEYFNPAPLPQDDGKPRGYCGAFGNPGAA